MSVLFQMLYRAHAVPSAFNVELLFFTGNYLPFKTEPKYNFGREAFPDFLHVTGYGQSPYLSPIPSSQTFIGDFSSPLLTPTRL